MFKVKLVAWFLFVPTFPRTNNKKGRRPQKMTRAGMILGKGHACPSLHYSLPPGKVQLWCIFFALLVMNGPLPAELKFRENTGFAISRLPSLCLEKRFCFGDIINPLLITKLALSIWMNVCLVHFYI